MMTQNRFQDLTESDYLDFEIQTEQLLNTGDPVYYNNKRLFVCQTVILMEEGILRYHYRLAPENGLKQKPICNQQLCGVSLRGTVVERQQDLVRVNLEVGGIQPQEGSCWFVFATAYTAEDHTGCYCLPEIGDTVQLYFPTMQEETAVVISSVRQTASEQMQKPEVKYFRTAYSKELKFQQDELTVSGTDAKLIIQLNDQTGALITSEGQIEIKARKDLTMDSKAKILITAQEGIDLKCQDGIVTINEIIRIQDKQIDKEPGVSF